MSLKAILFLFDKSKTMDANPFNNALSLSNYKRINRMQILAINSEVFNQLGLAKRIYCVKATTKICLHLRRTNIALTLAGHIITLEQMYLKTMALSHVRSN